MTSKDHTATVIYLHGLASSPASVKAKAFEEFFHEWGMKTIIPDLNIPEFNSLTISRARDLVTDLVVQQHDGEKLLLMGSSFGGLVSSHVAENESRKVDALCLMAPAFDMPGLWTRMLGKEGLESWRHKGGLEVEHPAYSSPQMLGYQFYLDAISVGTAPMVVDLPALVFQGKSDEVVAPEDALQFAKLNSGAELHMLEDGHDLGKSIPYMAKKLKDFLLRQGFIKL